MFQSDKKNNSLGTILGPDIEFSGDIKASGNIIIYGQINGNIICSGDVNTAKESKIIGDVKAQNIFISGKIEGNLNIENKVVLGKTGVLAGDIQSSILTIEEGGNFDGMCNMLKPSESKVQKISSISS